MLSLSYRELAKRIRAFEYFDEVVYIGTWYAKREMSDMLKVWEPLTLEVSKPVFEWHLFDVKSIPICSMKNFLDPHDGCFLDLDFEEITKKEHSIKNTFTPKCEHVENPLPLANTQDNSNHWIFCSKCGDWLRRA